MYLLSDKNVIYSIRTVLIIQEYVVQSDYKYIVARISS